jgi:hypothetical protein
MLIRSIEPKRLMFRVLIAYRVSSAIYFSCTALTSSTVGLSCRLTEIGLPTTKTVSPSRIVREPRISNSLTTTIRLR